jgi:hypothetical protein
MSISSNLYSEKVFAEQPIALWSLDDPADYVSLVSETQRDLSNSSVWTVSNGTLGVVTNIIGEPFPESVISSIAANVPEEDPDITTVTATGVVPYSSFNEDLKTFSLGAFFYSPSPFLSSVSIGYKYLDAETSSYVETFKDFDISVFNRWFFVSETFTLPPNEEDVSIVLKLGYLPGASDPASYTFLVNGLTAGQWSEEFQATSLGVELEAIPSTIALSETFGYPAAAYGLQELNGYYLGQSNSLLAKNGGVPLVYGASNNTTILPGSGPSLIVPGNGFLGELGRYQDFTLEFWLRINVSCTTPKRIVGPIGSDDGIYVDGPFIKIKIDDVYGSYFVGEWFRPMLVQLRIVTNSATLIINGEEVLSVEFDTRSLSLPGKNNSVGKDQDWIGFYAYEDTVPFEIDSVGIYSYSVPTLVAKRRWVYGQGVEYPEKINTAYNGVSTFIDYPFANYSNNYNFPDLGKWNQGLMDNVSVDNNVLTPPKHPLATLKFNNKTVDQWYEDSSASMSEEDQSISLRPNSSWLGTEGCIIFDTLNFLSQDTKAVYGIFESKVGDNGKQTLFKIEDQITKNYLIVELNGAYIDYTLVFNGSSTRLYRANGHQPGDLFLAGISLVKFSNKFGGNAAYFLGNKGQLKVYAGGSEDFSNTFNGEILKVAFSTERNYGKFEELYNDSGVIREYEDVFSMYDQEIDYDGDDPLSTNGSLFNDLYVDGGDPWSRYTADPMFEPASYGLVGRKKFGAARLDIEVDSYWEDYVPLTYLAKNIVDDNGVEEYGLDFVQMNINYPAVQKFSEGFYDTSGQGVRTYVSFQYLSEGANKPVSGFKNITRMPSNGVVEPGSDWLVTKYEVVDGVILYLPQGVDIKSLALVSHIEMKVDGIIENPIKIRRIQLASQSLSQRVPSSVGTRFGKKIYPFKRSGLYFDYKAKNPFRIYKDSTPYLYLTGQSGIKPVGNFEQSTSTSRGLSIPINPEKANNFETVALNMAIKFELDAFPSSPIEIFEVQSANQFFKFYAVSTHPDGLRGKIYSQNTSTGRITDRVTFYWNGNLVREPSIQAGSWSILGIGFTDNLIMNNVAGAIRITGPVSVDSISHYQASSLDQVRNQITRQWFGVERIAGIDIAWRYWAEGQDNPEGNRPYTWSQVLVVTPSDYYGVDPAEIYKSFVGTNKIVAGDDVKLKLETYKYSVYQGLDWTTSTITPV